MDPRAEFVRSLKGANVDGFFFATKEDANQVITSLLNPTMREPVKIDEANPLVIGYAGITDKKTNTTKTYQAVIVKSDNIFRFHVKDVDLGGGLVVDERVLPRPCPGQTTFPNQEACMDEFNCKIKPELECEANRTCQRIVINFDCCFANGDSLHSIVQILPGDPKCNVAFPLDIGTLVLKP